jgi:hypothetical protein
MAACPCCSGDREPRDGEPWAGHDRACPFRAQAPPPRRPVTAGAGAHRHAWPGGQGNVADKAAQDQRRRAWLVAWAASQGAALCPTKRPRLRCGNAHNAPG